MSPTLARLFVFLQRLTPKYLLTALVRYVASIRVITIKDFLIARFIALYDIEVHELRHPVPSGFTTLNDFFIRALVDGARPVDPSHDSIVSPVDGTVSAAGRIDRRRIFQAKGLDYSLTDLLATDVEEAERYVDGAFATIYLAPYNYHRVHAPVAGKLVAARYVPGALFSVNDMTVRNLPGLFARNERLVCHIHTALGPMAIIFVGALNVGTISTRWTGDVSPRRSGVVENIDLRDAADALSFGKGDTLGWFNMGSTVILLLPPGSGDAFAGLNTGARVRTGEPIGRFGKAE
ncbi:MAG: archaetidylserine decarboxylase [Gammaproteobacteria bacterium]|nr:archaetidylserine decarboxylase [Gammaproteobacteria bacterium]